MPWGLKEQPLINAVSNVGALPKFMTDSEIVSGIVAATACGFFGGLVMMFQASVMGGNADTMFATVRGGAIFGHAFALVVMTIAWGFYSFFEDEEYRTRYAASGSSPVGPGSSRGSSYPGRSIGGSRRWGRWSARSGNGAARP